MTSSISRGGNEAKPRRTIKKSAGDLRMKRRLRPLLHLLEDRRLLTSYVVSNTNYSGQYSLGAAITAADAAGGSSQITFNLPSNSTIALTGSDVSSVVTFGPTGFVISGASTNITIDGSNAPGLTISGGNAVRLFAVGSGETLVLENLTITDGKAQGGAGGSTGTGGGGGGGAGLGGGVYEGNGTFTAEGVTFTNNSAIGGAGGSSGVGSSTHGGGGGGLNGDGAAGSAGGAGGSQGGGGGVGVNATAGNGGFGGGGGGVHHSNTDGAGSGGFGGGGGGGTHGYADSFAHPGFAGGNGNASKASAGGGGGGGLGGGIFANGGTVTLIDDTFTANSAIGGAAGGGTHAGSPGLGYGGALFAVNSQVYADFATFSANTAEDGASPNHNALDGTDVFALSYFGGAGVNNDQSNLQQVHVALYDCILGQAASTTSDFVAYGNDGAGVPSLSGTNDLISNNSPSLSGSNAFPTGSTILSGDPHLNSLASNGGPTQTMSLKPTSAAKGAGITWDYPGTSTAITTDQSGATLNSPPDEGALAYFVPVTPTVTGVSPTDGTISGGTSVTITGTHLSSVSTVYFGTTAATSYNVVSSTEITAVSPSHAAGLVDVTVFSQGNTSSTSSADQFTFVSSTLTVSPSSLSLGTNVAGTAGTATSYTISGSSLVADVTITAPSGVQVSDDGGSTWHSSLTETPTSGTLAAITIDVRENSTVAGTISSSVTNASSGATTQDVTLSGSVSAAALHMFALSGLANGTAGVAQSLTVEAEDQYGNEITTYTGTVHFTSTDGQAVLPSNYTFTGGDAGQHSFTSGVTLKTSGSQTVTAADTVSTSVTGTTASVTISAAAASHFTLTGLTSATAGTAQTLTVEALDQYGNEASGYTGTVHFTSSDGQAEFPANYTFIVGDAGQHSFTSGVTLKTSGLQTVTAADTVNTSITGTTSSVTISAASLNMFVLSGLANGTAGVAQSLTVEAEDQYGNEITTYTGTVHFTSTDGQAVLPSNYTFTGGDAGQHSFTSGVTLKTSGSQTVTSADTVSTSVTGTTASVTISAAAASQFVLTGLSNAVAGTAQSLNVEVEDQYGNEASGYTGTVHFSSTDAQAVLPGNYTFTNGDSGSHTFTNGVTLKTSGSQTVTATDTVSVAVTGTSLSVTISSAAASQFVVVVDHVDGTQATVGVRAEDSFGNLATGYNGTVVFASSDAQATLPANDSMSAGEGTFVFSFDTLGTFSVTVADSVIQYLSGSTNVTINVQTTQSGNLVSSSPQVFYGQDVTLTATFSATEVGGFPMTGTVAFYDGSTYLGTTSLYASTASRVPTSTIQLDDVGPSVYGQANLASNLTVGNHTIRAVYSGDSHYSTATSDTPVAVQVAPATTSTILTSASSPQGTTLSAQVVVTSPGDPPITGYVAFFEGNTLLGTSAVIDGFASLYLGAIPRGKHIFRAVFTGGGTSSASGTSAIAEVDGPQVESVYRYGYHAYPTYLLVHFDTPLAAFTADRAKNYKIVGPSGDSIRVLSAIYDAGSKTVTLVPSEQLDVHRTYRLKINGKTSSAVTSLYGLKLDGKGKGVAGTNYTTSLTRRNLAGQAYQLPTRDLLVSVGEQVTTSAIPNSVKWHAAAGAHSLRSHSLRVPKRLGLR